MISHKSHTRYLLVGGLTLIGLLVVATPFVAGDEKEPAGSAERLRALLTERYELLKKDVANLQTSVEFGGADIFELSDAMTAMYHAEADLCKTDAERIKVYERLVETMKTHEKAAVWRADAGRMPESDLAKARLAIINAQIDLERLRLSQHLPTK
jgi:hypothetical protein